MRITATLVVTTVAAVAILGGGTTFLALGGWKMMGSSFDDDVSVDVSVTDIRAVGASGSVRVTPGAGPQVHIHRAVRYLSPLRERPGVTHRLDGTMLHLDTNCGTFCVIEYVVQAPEGVRVSGELTSGSFDLTGASSVDVTTSSGDVALNRVTGDIRAHTSSGAVKGQELRSGTIDVKTSSGRVHLDLASAGNVRAGATSGDLTLAVPDGTYRIVTETSSGSSNVKVSNDPSGLYHVDAHTKSGDITIVYR